MFCKKKKSFKDLTIFSKKKVIFSFIKMLKCKRKQHKKKYLKYLNPVSCIYDDG